MYTPERVKGQIQQWALLRSDTNRFGHLCCISGAHYRHSTDVY